MKLLGQDSLFFLHTANLLFDVALTGLRLAFQHRKLELYIKQLRLNLLVLAQQDFKVYFQQLLLQVAANRILFLGGMDRRKSEE